MKLTVTKEHIQQGIRQDCENCPVALALKGHGFEAVHVSSAFINAQDSIGRVFQPTPKLMREFINDFDEGVDVKPFVIDLPWLV